MKNHKFCCASTMSERFKEPTVISTLMMIRPIAIS